MNRSTYRAVVSTVFMAAVISAPSCTAFVSFSPIEMNADVRGSQRDSLPALQQRMAEHTRSMASNDVAEHGYSGEAGVASDDSDKRMMRFERKNASRKKFGLDPLSLEQFDEIEKQVRELEKSQQEKMAQQVASREARIAADDQFKESNRRKGGVFDGIFGGKMDNTCNSNDDCERPQVCCDLLVRKVCCSSGRGIFEGEENALRPALVPVPATVQQDSY